MTQVEGVTGYRQALDFAAGSAGTLLMVALFRFAVWVIPQLRD